jgi:hypothetical protein
VNVPCGPEAVTRTLTTIGLSKLAAAFANLAASVNALAAVVDAATGRLRQHLALEDGTATPAGRVIDHEPRQRTAPN